MYSVLRGKRVTVYGVGRNAPKTLVGIVTAVGPVTFTVRYRSGNTRQFYWHNGWAFPRGSGAAHTWRTDLTPPAQILKERRNQMKTLIGSTINLEGFGSYKGETLPAKLKQLRADELVIQFFKDGSLKTVDDEKPELRFSRKTGIAIGREGDKTGYRVPASILNEFNPDGEDTMQKTKLKVVEGGKTAKNGKNPPAEAEAPARVQKARGRVAVAAEAAPAKRREKVAPVEAEAPVQKRTRAAAPKTARSGKTVKTNTTVLPPKTDAPKGSKPTDKTPRKTSASAANGNGRVGRPRNTERPEPAKGQAELAMPLGLFEAVKAHLKRPKNRVAELADPIKKAVEDKYAYVLVTKAEGAAFLPVIEAIAEGSEDAGRSRGALRRGAARISEEIRQSFKLKGGFVSNADPRASSGKEEAAPATRRTRDITVADLNAGRRNTGGRPRAAQKEEAEAPAKAKARGKAKAGRASRK